MELLEALGELLTTLFALFPEIGHVVGLLGGALYQASQTSEFASGVIGFLCCPGGFVPWLIGVWMLYRIVRGRFNLFL